MQAGFGRVTSHTRGIGEHFQSWLGNALMTKSRRRTLRRKGSDIVSKGRQDLLKITSGDLNTMATCFEP